MRRVEPPTQDASARRHGIRFNAWNLQRRADRRWKKAGLKRVTPHDCRHFAGTLWLESGVSIMRVSKWLGHASVTVTLNVYAYVFEGREAEEMGKVDEYLERAEMAGAVGAGFVTPNSGSSGSP